jgi:release factor glutamine methyltransferase
MKINDILKKDTDIPLLEKRILMQKACGFLSKEELFLNIDKILTLEESLIYNNFKDRRLNHEPIAYIIESKEFYGHEFYVNKNVLIPRPETEIIVDEVLKIINKNKNYTALEIGAGSLAISLAILLNANNIEIDAVDISKEALIVANINKQKYDNQNKITLIESDLFLNLPHKKYDIIFSNPPYVNYKDTHLMSYETKTHEPHLALFAKNEGLFFYEEISKNSHKYLNLNGYIVLEIGINQHYSVLEIFSKQNYQHIKTIEDLNKIPRIMIFSNK